MPKLPCQSPLNWSILAILAKIFWVKGIRLLNLFGSYNQLLLTISNSIRKYPINQDPLYYPQPTFISRCRNFDKFLEFGNHHDAGQARIIELR